MAVLTVKVDGINEITYEAQSGVAVGKNFLNKQQFRQWFEELLGAKNTQEYIEFANILEANVKKLTTIHEQEITKFSKNLADIQQKFLNFSARTSFDGSLGGDIGLLTTFSFGQENSNTYFIYKEEELPSRIRKRSGGVAYTNTYSALEELVQDVNKGVKMNSNFQHHLQNFYIQLQDPKIANNSERQNLYIWAQHNMKRRYLANDGKTPMSLAKYFWGEGHLHGYISEAYGSHLMLTHSNFLVDEHVTELKKSVIEEHGGPGSNNLFTLLASTKGNTSSQLSGDIVIVDSEGRIKFNVQSKASMRSSYGIYITYQKFLSDVYKFLTIYKGWDNKTEQEKNEDLDVLFQAFSTTAWVPIQEQLNRNIHEEYKNMSK